MLESSYGVLPYHSRVRRLHLRIQRIFASAWYKVRGERDTSFVKGFDNT